MQKLLESIDLTALHVIGTIFGVLLAIYAAQAMWHDSESQRDCWLVRYGRKLAYPILALAFLWSLDYAYTKGWTPWAPDVVIIWAIDAIISFRILAIRVRQKEIAARGWFRPDGVDAPRGL